MIIVAMGLIPGLFVLVFVMAWLENQTLLGRAEVPTPEAPVPPGTAQDSEASPLR